MKRRLEAAGFEEVSQKGSHVKFAKSTDEETRTAIAPHYREITIDTLGSILRQAGISGEEFEVL
ncbi:MAG: type II toxin-antitoxin system HicA family toxin [Nostoc sp.]